MAELALTSAAFGNGEEISRRQRATGDDVSPPLAWSGQPAETESLALVLDRSAPRPELPRLRRVREPQG